MKTAIATDSNSGIFPQEAQTLGVYVLPMPVIIEGTSYVEGVDLTHAQFFQALADGKEVATSQPAPGDVMALWDKALADGYDEVVYIPMSAGISASCQTAQMLAGDYEGKVWVVDNRRISVSQRSAVMDALALVQAGYEGQKIKQRLEDAAEDGIIYLGVETLEYFKRGGRITPAAAAIGTLLNLKPLLSMTMENFDVVAKVRGTKNCRAREVEALVAFADKLRAQGKKIRVGVAGSFAQQAGADEWFQQVKAAFPDVDVYYDPLSLCVCCHTGPDAFGAGICSIVEP